MSLLVVASVVGPAAAAAPSERLDRTGQFDQARQLDAGTSLDRGGSVASMAENNSTVDDAASDRSGREVDPALRDAEGTVEIVVRLGRPSLPPQAADRATAVSTLRRNAERSQGQIVRFARGNDGIELVEQFYLANAVLLRVDTDRANLQRLAALDDVTRIHANFQVTVPEPDGSAAEGPNGTAGDVSPAASASGPDTTYGLDQINASETWDTFDTQGGGVKVAVLDTGVAVDHPDIDLHTEDPSDPTYPGGWAEFNGTGGIVEGSEPRDTGYHGTHTSGTVSGGNASGEYVGVAPNVSLMHGLVLPDGRGSFAQIIAGMEWAVEHDADVISMSLGAPGYHSAMIEPVRNAESAGTVVVAATGNDGPGTSHVPGNVYEALAVGASTSDGAVASFSGGEAIDTDDDWNYAAPSSWPDRYVVPNVVAPGSDVRSAVPKGTFPNFPDAQYGSASGTSMATPHVAGAVALMLAAAEGNDVGVSNGEVKSALSGTAWKPDRCYPDCERDATDSRYGDGIVNVHAAASRLAGAQGIDGTVVDGDGEPMAGVEVSLASGFTTTTDDDGHYRIRGTPGTYEVATDAFGYERANATVTVPEGTFVTRQLTLRESVEARVTSGLPGAVRRGGVVGTTIEVANAESLTVDLSGEYDVENATLFVDGREQEFGQPVEFSEPRTGEVTVSVRTDDNATGSFSLSMTTAGLGDATTVTVGPMDVYGEIVEVAAVQTTDPGDRFGDHLEASLDAYLTSQYRVTMIDNTEMTDVVDDYDVFVVQKFPGGPEEVEALLEATSGPDTGLVLLDNLGQRTADAVPQVSRATGNPDATDGVAQFVFFGDDQVYYEINKDHPIFDGVGSAGDSVPLYGSFYQVSSWFEGYDGTTLADVRHAGGVPGGGVAVDELSRTVMLSSMGYRNGAQNGLRTVEAHEILANSVRYAAAVPPVTITNDQPTHAAPGESIDVNAKVTDLDEYTVEIAEGSTLSADDLTLYVDGREAAFGEPIAYDGVTSGDFSVRVVPDDAVGSVSLEHTFVAGEEDATVSGRTATTAVYEPPLTAGDDVATIQEAVDLAPRGATVLVEGGTYTEQVVVNTTDVDVRPRFGEDVTIRAPADLSGDRVVTIRGQQVNVSGFTVEAGGDNVGVYVDDADRSVVSGTTVRNATHGVYSSGTDRVTIDDNTVRGAGTGIEVEFWYNHQVTGNDVSDVDQGIRVSKSRGLLLANNTITDARTVGMEMIADRMVSANNTIEGPQVGIWMVQRAEVRDTTIANVSTGVGVYRNARFDFRRNTVRNADVGFDFYAGTKGAIRANELAADTGVLFDRREEDDTPRFTPPYFDFDDIDVRYNDFSGSGVAINSTSDDTVDARLNYYGPRGPTSGDAAFAGSVVHDPFLTAPPSAVDPDNTTALGTAVSLPAGEEYALGVPGPTNRTVGEMLGEDFEGDVYRYQSRGEPWVAVDSSYVPSALEALRVVPESDARAVLSFQGTASATERDLVRGWNFVAAPTTGAVEAAFADSSADLVRIQPTRGDVTLAEPTGQLGTRGSLDDTYRFGKDATEPTVSPFGGYFVLADADGTLPANLTANPTIDEFYAGLELADQRTVDVTVTPTANATFGESVAGASPAQREAVVDAVTAAFADTPDHRAAIRANVSTALETAPEATIRAALDEASDEEAAAILAALDAAEEGAATDDDAADAMASPSVAAGT